MADDHIHLFMRPLIAVNVGTIVAANFLVPIWGKMIEQVHGNLQTAGIAVSIFSIIIGFFILVAGKIEHKRRNEELMVVVTSTLIAFTYLGYFFISHPWHLYLIQATLGLLTAFHSPAIYSLYHRYMPKTHSALHWGFWNSSYFMSSGVAAFLSAFLAQRWGLKAVFTVLFITALMTAFLTGVVAIKMRKENGIG